MGANPFTRYGSRMSLPFHPLTNVQALGFTKRGLPIWPVMGASEDPPPDSPDDRGYPEGTPIAEMTDAQKAAYYKDQNKHTDRLRGQLSAFNGFTPDDVHAMWSRLEQLEGDRLTADEKAVREATEKAAADARAAVEADLRPKLLASQLQAAAAAANVLHGEQLSAWMNGVDASKFVGDNGEIDGAKVKDTLTAIFGTGGQGHQWGQNGSRPPGKSASEAGLAEARRRGYIKD